LLDVKLGARMLVRYPVLTIVGTGSLALAIALGAARLFLLTDVAGVLDKQKNLLTDLTPPQIHALRADGTITGGMIPKLETCVHAVEGGVDAAVVLDGRVPHAMLLEIFTRRGAGTLVRAG
jgi:acetylglutamate kinase